MTDFSLPGVSPGELERQREYTARVRAILEAQFPSQPPKAFVHTYGCQGNVADSERLKGQLSAMGYVFTEEKEQADLVLFGHLHVRIDETAEGVRIFNPGSAAKPRDGRAPSFGLIDIFESGILTSHGTLPPSPYSM